jgi:proteasome lid subunit RPN8/RPN11
MTWKDKALEHAKEQDPKESCGLLLNIRGKEKYFPCRNLSMNDNQCFIIDPEDYVRADNIGDITAIIHSHPVTPAVASEADKISCEQSNLPWYIVNPKTETWGEYRPSGYKPDMIGLPYVWGISDCWSLVRRYYAEKLNIELRDWERPITPEEFMIEPMFEKCAKDTGFRELRSDEKLKNNDLLFMSIGEPGLNHVAIFVDGDVIHHLRDRLSCREPYNPWLLKCTGMRLRYASQN